MVVGGGRVLPTSLISTLLTCGDHFVHPMRGFPASLSNSRSVSFFFLPCQWEQFGPLRGFRNEYLSGGAASQERNQHGRSDDFYITTIVYTWV